MKRVVILGASGFVGASLFEFLLGKGNYELLPVIHSPGNAWRLSRHPTTLYQADLLNSDDLSRVLSGVDCVINCTRGDNDFMIQGLKNIIKVCRSENVSRLIHLSSIMVFGDPPVAETEDVKQPKLPPDSYGSTKQVQDRMIEKSASSGLPSIILVPPNISGPYSYFLLALLSSLRAHEIALIDEGNAPVCIVDISNLCHAIELSMHSGQADGSRYFITDDEDLTWGTLVADLQKIHGEQSSVATIRRDELEKAATGPDAPKASIVRSMKHLVSSDIREALRKDPFWETVDQSIRKLVAKMGPRVEDRFRLSIEGPERITLRDNRRSINVGLCAQQFRNVRPSIAKARAELGYSPLVDYRTSISAFSSWYRQTHALDGEFRDLLIQLYE